jgi:hypothetical protein
MISIVIKKCERSVIAIKLFLHVWLFKNNYYLLLFLIIFTSWLEKKEVNWQKVVIENIKN